MGLWPASDASPAIVARAAPAANASPCSIPMKKTIGPATTGSATSQPLTAVPQRLPARLSARIKNGTSVSLNANSADIRPPPGSVEEIYSMGEGNARTWWPSGAVAAFEPCGIFLGRVRFLPGGFARMARVNEHYLKLKTGYLFPEIGRRGRAFDTANILDIFALDNKVAIGDPVYPVYNDTNVMIGRSGPADERGYYQGIVYLPCTEANGFFPSVPKEKVDIVYLCSPNNPTGTVATKAQLKGWVGYALANDAVIFFDAAYEAFITEPRYPRSIYEIEGAKRCAVEFRSFSKTAGFTGVRCARTVVPGGGTARAAAGGRGQLDKLWERRR